jgi:eukaryotic-like serine/threonine-protein kinase
MSGSTASRLPAAIGRYQVLKELGRGMMGVVYLAKDPALERLIALKTIDLAFSVPEAERASFEQRFLAEARVAGRLQHPGIVVVHDVGRDDAQGILYIALEYLQGRTLAELAAAGPLPWPEALRIVAGVARALHHAHARSIVHRDVKPANVMVVASGQPKIMDFGIAKVPAMELTSSGQFFGTPLYMSPEQASGDPLDGRSDLFSLGAVTYHLLTGRHAFGADSVVRVLARVAGDQPPPPSHLVPELPPAVDALVARAMKKDPAQRYATGDEMADAVDALLAGRPTPAVDAAPELDADVLLDEILLTTPSARPPAPRPPTVPPAAAGSVVDPAALQSLADLIPRPRAARQPWFARPPVWMAAAIVLLAAGAFLLGRRAADPRAEKGPAAARADQPRREAAPAIPPPEAAAVADGDGRLEVNFEHHLSRGRIQIWIDDEDVLDQPFDSRVRQQILSLRLRKGDFQQVLPVSPGRHQVRVRLTWSGRVREQRISGTFAAGQERTLAVRVSRVFNELSLKWQ